mgnify:CR=1 FL=1
MAVCRSVRPVLFVFHFVHLNSSPFIFIPGMHGEQTTTEFYQELHLKLPKSSAEQRSFWTHAIIQEDIPLSDLLPLACEEKPVASRFLWLLGDIAETAPKVLFPCLHQLFEMKEQINGIDVNRSFAKFWQLCGIPVEHEAEAIDLLFKWLNESKSNVSLKIHAGQALFNALTTYPALHTELRDSLEAQLGKSTKSFNLRAGKILSALQEM